MFGKVFSRGPVPRPHSILIGLIFFSQLSWAQTTATIGGVVQDESGGVIPGVAVTVRSLDTGMSRTAHTDERGRYLFPSLAPGNYELQTQMAGFQTEVRSGITLTVGREASISFTLRVGEVTQTISVTGEAPLVDTTSSSIGGNVDPAQVRDLPLNARSFEQLALLQPGVVFGKTSVASTGDFSRGRTRRVIIHGSRPDSNNFMMDGTDINSFSNQTPGSVAANFMGVDAIREFRVETSSYSAQYGRNSGGAINIVTKSGTNEFHGTVFEFLRNDNLDARNFFDGKKDPEFRRNQFGFSMGGPVIRDKTFFFGNYEGLRESLGTSLLATVPSLGARNGVVRNQAVIIDPAIRPFLELYPLSNGRDFGDGTAERIDVFNQPTSENLYSARLDHSFSEADSFFARYTSNPAERSFTNTLATFPLEDTSHNQFATVEEKHIFSPSLLNAFRMGFTRNFAEENLVPQVDVSHLPEIIPGNKPFLSGGTNLSGAGLTAMGDTRAPRLIAYESYQWVDDLFYTLGAHSLKFGGVINWIRNTQNQENATGGDVSFTGSVENFLLGNVDLFGAPAPGSGQHRIARQKIFGWYLQDDMQVKSNLTVNLGLRHEFATSPAELRGKLSNLITLSDSAMTVGTLFTTDKNLFAPRFGFAWDPFQNGKTSLRGGFGIFYDMPLINRWRTPLQSNPPFFALLQVRNVPFSRAFERVTSGTPAIELRPITFQGTTSSTRYDFSVQRELPFGIVVSGGYSGALGRHLPRRADENTRVPVIRPDGTKVYSRTAPLINPLWSSSRRLNYDTNSSYNGLLASLRKRFSAGLQFQASYTWSKAIDAGTGIEGTESSTGAFSSMDPYDWKRDQGLSDFDARHNFVFNYSYELPLGQGKRFLTTPAATWLVSDWQLNGILSLSSGAHFEVINGFEQSLSGARPVHERPDLRPGGNNDPKIGSPDRWFDTSQFQLQEPGVFGNLGRNTVEGPGLASFDLSIFRNFGLSRVSEHLKIQFRAEFFNLFNKPNFDTPLRSVFTNANSAIAGNAGRVQRTTTSSRQIQFGLRIEF